MVRPIAFTACSLLIAYAVIKDAIRHHQLSHIPLDFQVKEIIFSAQYPNILDLGHILVSLTGFSGGSTGAYVYKLPPTTRKKVVTARFGPSRTNNLTHLTRTQSIFKSWHPTPIPWATKEQLNSNFGGEWHKTRGVASFFLSYSFGEKILALIPSDIQKEIDQSLTTTGNIYMGNQWWCTVPRDCSQLIIIAPEENKIFFIFASD